jgi:MerR family transcriptional regulator, thiopeptide resistance regulator
MGRRYRVGEVAALTGVSVRTLHHYDRIGLLRPADHSEGGHRLYGEDDLIRLQQVLTLRYLGFRLARVKELLGRPEFDVLASMRIQRQVVQSRIAELHQIDTALAGLIDERLTTGAFPWDLAVRATAAVQSGLTRQETAMSNVERYYTPEQMQQFAQLREQIPAGEITAIEQGWRELLTRVRAARDTGLDPASAEARALLERWTDLLTTQQRMFSAAPGLWEAIGENYRKGNFDAVEGAPTADDFAFIERVRAAGGAS